MGFDRKEKKKIRMKKTLIIFAVVLIVIIAAFILLGQKKETEILGSEDYQGISYEVGGIKTKLGGAGVEAAPGSAAKIVTNYFGNETKGDINNDGAEDVGFFITQTTGGSGTFYYAVAAIKKGESYEGTNAIFLGDRIAPQTMEIRNGILIVNYADRRAGDPMTTSPSVGKSKYLAVESGKLVESPIFVETPLRGSVVSSPLKVQGVARGTWFFEASFPVLLADPYGKTVASGVATAQGDWMTTDYVRFSASLEFKDAPESGTGKLILKKDNPSGLPENEDFRGIPIVFGG